MQTITGSGSSTLKPIASEPTTPPQAYFGAARSLLPGVRLLAAAGPEACVPLTLVAGQALEGLLKAYLSKRGTPESELKQHAVRHNLKELWQRAVRGGLPIPPAPPQWVECLSGLHDSPFHLRYPMGLNGLVLPGAQPMAAELEALLEVVRQNIQ